MKTKEHYKIGEVVSILIKEYPDITASAIRYWESKDLLTPSSETKGGQRVYTKTDIKLIRYIKELSRCEYSIKNIREKICELKENRNPIYLGEVINYARKELGIARYTKLYHLLSREEKMEPIYSRNDLIKILRSKIAKKLLNRAIKYKLILPVRINRKLMFSAYDEIILRTIIYVDENLKDILGDWEKFIEKCKELYNACKYIYKTFHIWGELQLPIEDYSEVYIKNALFNIISEELSPKPTIDIVEIPDEQK